MVLPLDLNGLDQGASEGIPQVVKDSYAKFWWAYIVLMSTLVVLRCVAGDLLGAMSSMILGLITWCMVKDNCARMSQLCVFCFTAMCVAQTFIESIALIGLLGGRTLGETTSVQNDGATHTFTTVVERHPFFDPTLGTYYNLQSAVIMAAPIISLVGLLLGYMTYKAFPTSIFEQADGPQPYDGYGTTLGGGGSFGGGGPVGGGNRLGGSGGPRPMGGGSAGQALGRAASPMFSGEGQRLGAS